MSAAPERQGHAAEHAEQLVTTRRGAVPVDEVVPADRVACWQDSHLAWRPVRSTRRQRPRPALLVRTRGRTVLVGRDSAVLCLRRTDRIGLGGERTWQCEWTAAGDLRRGDPIVLVDERALDDGAPDRLAAVHAGGFRGVLAALRDPRFTAERVLAVRMAGPIEWIEPHVDGADNYVVNGAVVALTGPRGPSDLDH